MEEETWSRRGWGGGVILKIVIARGGTIFICNYFGGGEVLIHHTINVFKRLLFYSCSY